MIDFQSYINIVIINLQSLSFLTLSFCIFKLMEKTEASQSKTDKTEVIKIVLEKRRLRWKNGGGNPSCPPLTNCERNYIPIFLNR